jgi:PAS domain S-box-containing protein
MKEIQMKDQNKTKKQLIDELTGLKQRISELKNPEGERRPAAEAEKLFQRFLEISHENVELSSLLSEFAQEIRKFTQCSAIGIRILDEYGNIPYKVYLGFSQKFYELESPLSIKSDQCMCINVIRGTADPKLPFYTEGGSFYMNGTSRFLSTVSEEEKGKTRNVCNEVGYESVALIPIRAGNRLLGLIHVADTQENKVPLDRVKLLEGVGRQLGLGIDRVLAVETLSGITQKLNAAQRVGGVGSWSWDQGSGKAIWSEGVFHIYGRALEQGVPPIEHWLDNIHPDDREPLQRAIREALDGKRPYNIDYRIRRYDNGQEVIVHGEAVVEYNKDGVPLVMMGTAADVTWRKKVEGKLREYERVVENSQDMVVVVDKDYKYALANGQFLKYRCLGKDQVIGRSVRDVVGVDVFERTIRKNLEACFRGEVIQYEMKHVYPELGERDLLVHYFPIENPDGINRVVSTIQDITDRKRAEERLRKSEARFASIFHASPVAIAITRLKDGKLVDVNDAWQKSTGFTREEAIERTPIELNSWVNPGERDRLVGKLQEQGTVQDFEFQVRDKSGNISHMLMSAEMIELAGERCMLSLAQDITERKRLEEELHKNREFLNSILDNAPMLIYVVSADNRYRLVNKAWEEFVGKCREEVIGLSVEQTFSSKIAGKFLEQNQEVLNHGLPLLIEEEVPTPLGTHHFYTTRFPLFNDRGKIEAVGGISLDITERKQGEERIRKLTRFLEAVIDNANTWIDVLDGNANVLIWNKAAEMISGYSSQEVMGHDRIWEWLYPDGTDQERLKDRVIDFMQRPGENREIESVIRTKAGQSKIISWYSRNLVDDQNAPVGSVVLGQDITERKRVEEALRQSERELTTIFDGAPVMMLVVDGNYRVRKANRTMQAALGATGAELNGVPCGDVLRCLHRLDSPEGCRHGPKCEACALRQAVKRTLETTVGVSGVEAVFETETKEQPCRSSFLLSTNFLRMGDEAMVLVCLEDITERKLAGDALREAHQDLQSLVNASPLAIVELDFHGNVSQWNPAAERIFGWDKQEVLGKPLPIIPKEKGEQFQKDVKRILEGVGFSSLEGYRQKKDGTMVAVNVSSAPLLDANGSVKGAIGILEDITERKRVEEEREQLLDQLRRARERMQELSRRLVESQEAERRDLSRELHDEVGQNLTALSLNLNIIENLIPEKVAKKIKDRVDDSQKLVEETVVRIRDVMARLRPPVLDDYGLFAALNWFGKQFEERTGIAVTLSGDELADRFPLKTETALFRITQEALTNITKHARASQVTLTLESRDDGLRLIIADNGMGFDPEVHHQPGTRPEWGLINMRERALSIGGQLQVETAPGKGTKIIVEVPRNT